MKSKIKVDYSLVSAIILVIIGYVLLHDLVGGTLFDHNAWDSYTLQTLAWLNGKVSLGQNYDWLELAVYNNDWYVSFPPFPSVLMLPWVLIFGANTPNNIIMIIYVILTIIVADKCFRYYRYSEEQSAFWAVVIVLGSNMVWMSTMGGVWFQAQLLNMLFCLTSILCALYNKRKLAYICIACAFGCRPFSVIYLIFLLLWFYEMDKKKDLEIDIADTVKEELEEKDEEHNKEGFLDNVINFIKTVCIGQWKTWIVPAVMAIIYMLYNYVRFDNPFEFGHNYLPEFTESENGQFSSVYLFENLYKLFIQGIKFTKTGQLEIPIFNGFWLYVANPFFIILIVYIINNIIDKKFNYIRVILLITMMLNIISLCMHKTLGGWQFGARYTVDLIPYAMMYVLLSKEKKEFAKWEYVIGIFGIMFNTYGVMYMKK